MLTKVGYTVACMELVRVRIGEDEGEAGPKDEDTFAPEEDDDVEPAPESEDEGVEEAPESVHDSDVDMETAAPLARPTFPYQTSSPFFNSFQHRFILLS